MVPVSRLDELVRPRRRIGGRAPARSVGCSTERLSASTRARWPSSAICRGCSTICRNARCGRGWCRCRRSPTRCSGRSATSRASLGKNVRWEVRGGDTELDRGVLQQLADPLLHLVRNAVDHGIEPPAERVAAGKPEQATVVLHAMQLGSEVIITVTDDGRGIDVDRVREQAVAARRPTCPT